jgi:hypothetical protein
LRVSSDSGDPQDRVSTRRSSLVRRVEAETAVDPNLPGHSDGRNVSAPSFTASQSEEHSVELGEAVRSEGNPMVNGSDAQYASESPCDLKVVRELLNIFRCPTVGHGVPKVCFDLA